MAKANAINIENTTFPTMNEPPFFKAKALKEDAVG